MRVLVRGAGVVGLSVALELSRGKAQVLVLERSTAIGVSAASWLAGGMLAPFCESEDGGEEIIALGQGCAQWWETALPGLVRRRGTLVVALPRDQGEIGRLAARTRGWQHLSSEEVATLEPDLAGRFHTGLLYAGEAHLDPRSALARLHEKLVSEGVQFVFGSVDTPPGRCFDRTVDCTGMGAQRSLADLRGVRGEMLCLETREVTLSRPVRLLHPRFPAYVVPRGDGQFMIGATMIESSDAGPATARSVLELLNAAYALHPAFGEGRVTELGAGVRPAFADNLPKVIESGGAVHVNGAYRHGFVAAPALARAAVDLVFGKSTQKGEGDAINRKRRTS